MEHPRPRVFSSTLTVPAASSLRTIPVPSPCHQTSSLSLLLFPTTFPSLLLRKVLSSANSQFPPSSRPRPALQPYVPVPLPLSSLLHQMPLTLTLTKEPQDNSHLHPPEFPLFSSKPASVVFYSERGPPSSQQKSQPPYHPFLYPQPLLQSSFQIPSDFNLSQLKMRTQRDVREASAAAPCLSLENGKKSFYSLLDPQQGCSSMTSILQPLPQAHSSSSKGAGPRGSAAVQQLTARATPSFWTPTLLLPTYIQTPPSQSRTPVFRQT